MPTTDLIRLPASVTRRAVLLAAPAIALIGAVPGAAARQLPASDRLVRGTAAAPESGPVAWRVVQDVAEPAGSAVFEQRALGFALNTSPFDPMSFTDEETGTAFRLNPGEAAFTADGVSQKRESFGDRAVGYLRIALIPAADAGDAGGDRLRFAGSPFDLAPGRRSLTLTLLRARLEPGSELNVPTGSDFALVLIEQGEATLAGNASSERLTTVVGSDAAYAIRSVSGRAFLVDARPATSVVVATIE